MNHFVFLVVWKRELMRKLDQNILREFDWKDFIETAWQFGYPAMAADMENRLKHYQEQANRGAEQCTRN